MASNRIRVAAAGLVLISWAAAQNETAGSADRVAIVPRLKPAEANLLRPDLRVDASLVLIPVHVATALGNSVTSLSESNFKLFEDGVRQRIATFAKEDAPVSIGLLFDTSGSMRDKIGKASQAAIGLLESANPEDEFFLIEFNSKPALAVAFTNDVDDIRAELARAKTRGQTSLLDAIQLAISQMKSARYDRKALVIVSDGGDNHSRHSEREIKNAMFEADVEVYAMGIFDPQDAHSRTREERNGPRLLDEIAAETGGRHFPVRNLNELPDICARIADELRTQYVIGYAPSGAARDGKYRRVRVTISARRAAAARAQPRRILRAAN